MSNIDAIYAALERRGGMDDVIAELRRYEVEVVDLFAAAKDIVDSSRWHDADVTHLDACLHCFSEFAACIPSPPPRKTQADLDAHNDYVCRCNAWTEAASRVRDTVWASPFAELRTRRFSEGTPSEVYANLEEDEGHDLAVLAVALGHV